MGAHPALARPVATEEDARWQPALPGGTRERVGAGPYLVGDAVEDTHGQVGHIGVGVCGQVQQHTPDLRVDTVEGHACGEGAVRGCHRHTGSGAGLGVRGVRVRGGG